MNRKIFIMIGLLTLLLVTLSASGQSSPIDPNETHTGQATYYDLEQSGPLGNCSFPGIMNGDLYAALNTEDYGTAEWCGAFIEVTGPNGSVVVQVVDQCPIASNPICTDGHVDLDQAAFGQIGDIIDGIIPITWTLISPENMNGNIEFHFKEGSSQWWTAVSIRNHRNPITSFEVEKNGQWVALSRTDYNYFLDESGMGTGPFNLRVTDIYGNQIVTDNVQLGDDVVRPGSDQFPIAGGSTPLRVGTSRYDINTTNHVALIVILWLTFSTVIISHIVRNNRATSE